MGYDFIIEYKPGKQNVGADALSRMDCFALSLQECALVFTLKDQLVADLEYSHRILNLCAGQTFPYFREHDGLLYWKDRIVVPKQSPSL